MFAGFSGDLGTLALGLVIAGTVAGLVAGMLGMGAGIVIVPVLYHVLSIAGVPEDSRMHVAVGTSLAALFPAALSSLSTHARNGAVDWSLVKRWAAPMLVGVVAASAGAAFAPGQWLALVFGAIAIPIAVYLGIAKPTWRLSESAPRGIGGGLIAFVIGGVSALMGVSGALKSVLSLGLCSVPAKRAAGTASAFAVLISFAAAIGAVVTGWGALGLPPYSYGYVNLLGFAVVAPMLFLVTPIAAKFSHMADTQRLRRTFALFVVVTAAKLVWDAVS
jgi:uncharacterized membrane protein YfcA